jgi:hypothetical protein
MPLLSLGATVALVLAQQHAQCATFDPWVCFGALSLLVNAHILYVLAKELIRTGCLYDSLVHGWRLQL